MKTLLVVAHPRRQSLTFAVADAFAAAIQERDHEIEWADLVREGFDPVILEPDEPDWSNPDKRYSESVDAEMARVERNAATVLVFPVWWWSIPAILKGWIDRVWNNGWAYGSRFYPQRRVWMLAIAGVGEDAYKKRRYDDALRTQLEVGVRRPAPKVRAPAGLGGKGVAPSRRNDTFGLALERTQFSSAFIPFLRERLDLGLEHEDVFEAYYNFAITGWLSATADLQIVNSGLKKTLNSSGTTLVNLDADVIADIRFRVRF
jgi:NAD(P)H dehydrogenase (quinone)